MDKVFANPAWQSVLRYLQEHEAETIEELVRLAETPAPTFAEARRAHYVQERLGALGMADVTRDDVDNVVGLWPGMEAGEPAILVAAHMDLSLIHI